MTDPRVWGGDSEGSIDTVNQWMRAQPWYTQQLHSWGITPGNVNLYDAQRTALLKLAQAHGVVVDEGKIEVDPAGNFNPIGHKLRNTLIGVGLAAGGLGLAGAGAGAFSGSALGAGFPALEGGGTLAANLGGAGALGAGGAGLAGAGAGAASRLGWPARLALSAIPAATATLPKLFQGGGDGSGGDSNIPPELSQLLALALKRMTDQGPLAASVNAQALGGLPTIYQRGGG